MVNFNSYYLELFQQINDIIIFSQLIKFEIKKWEKGKS